MGQGSALSPSNVAAFCEEKHRLEKAFLQAIQDLVGLHHQQAQALRQGDRKFSHLDPLIHMASEKKWKVKYALMGHVETHHC